MSANIDDLRKTREAYIRLFKSPNGKIVMADLRHRWLDSAIVGKTAEETIARAAMHDVIQTIINFADKDKYDGKLD